MKKITILLILVLPISASAFSITKKIKSWFSKDKVQKIEKKQIELPPFPQMNKDATSTSVFDKSGAIYNQGKGFKRLSLEEKRSYRSSFIQELYFVVYTSIVSKEKLVSLLNVLENGGSREGVYRSLVLNSEYSILEGYEEKVSPKLIDFVNRYTQKFLNRKYKKEHITQLNLYALKRILAEKSLELIDAFPKDGKDIKSWYAVFSADLASMNNSVFKTKLRKSLSPAVHYNWANTADFQHIKSEIIIKLHKMMNSLQG